MLALLGVVALLVGGFLVVGVEVAHYAYLPCVSKDLIDKIEDLQGAGKLRGCRSNFIAMANDCDMATLYLSLSLDAC